MTMTKIRRCTTNTSRRHWQLSLLFFCFCGVLLLLLDSCEAYRMGDAIDAEILIPKSGNANNNNDEIVLKRGQMPLFGMNTGARLNVGDVTQFSVVLEEGFRSLPLVSLVKKQSGGSTTAMLESLEIAFVFSRSSGEIHALHHHPTYKTKAENVDNNREIVLRYKWIEEESVDLNGGAFCMFLAVFVVSLFFLVDLCGLCSADDDYVYEAAAGNSSSNDLYYSYETSGAVAGDPMAVMPPAGVGVGAPKYE